MKNYIKYLKETKAFWLIAMVATVFFALYASVMAIKLNLPTDYKHMSQETIGNLLVDNPSIAFDGMFAQTVLTSAFDEPGIVTCLSSIMIFMVVVALVYHFMFRGKSDSSVFERLPISAGSERIYEVITAFVLAAIGVFTAFCCIVPATVRFSKQIKDYVFESEAGLYFNLGIYESIGAFAVVLLFIWASLMIIHLFGELFKITPVGYIVALFFARLHVIYMNPCEYFKMTAAEVDPGRHIFYLEYAPFLLLSVIIAGLYVYIKTVGKIRKDSGEVFNFPIAGWSLIIIFTVYMNTCEPLVDNLRGWIVNLSYGYIFLPPIAFMFDIALIIAAVIYFMVRRKRSQNVSIKVAPADHKGAIWETLKPGIIMIAVITALTLTIYFFGAYNTYNFIFEGNLEGRMDIALEELFVDINCNVSPFEISVALYALVKLVKFVLQRTNSAAEKFDKFPVKKSFRFLISLVSECLALWLPISCACVFELSVFKKYSSYAAGSYGMFELDIWNEYILAIAGTALIVALINFIEMSFANLLIRGGVCVTLVIIATCMDELIATGFDIYGNADYINIVDRYGYGITSLIMVIAALIIALASYIVCRKDTSRNVYKYAAAKYIFLFLYIAAFVLLVIFITQLLWCRILLLAAGGAGLFLLARRSKER